VEIEAICFLATLVTLLNDAVDCEDYKGAPCPTRWFAGVITKFREKYLCVNLWEKKFSTCDFDDCGPPIQSFKGNVCPITCHEGTEGEKRYSSTLSVISALEAGVWSTPLFGRITPEKAARYPLYRRLGRTRAGLNGCGKSRPPPGFDPRTVHSL
jgi:hypothetical protein